MYVRPRRVALAALVAASSLLLAACDGGSDSASGSGGKKDKGAPSAPAAPAAITADQAQQALVALTDLPAGWKLEPNTGLDKSQGGEEEIGNPSRPECAPITAVLNTGRLEEDHKANAQVVFTKKGDQTTVAQDVSGYERAVAEKAMAGLRTAVEKCAAFDAKESGKKATVKVKKAAGQQPKYGDESVSYSVTVVSGGMQMDFDLGTVRSHGAITTVLNNYSDHGDRGKAAFGKALAKAAEKLTAAASKTA
ncbi:hypothetical protein [Streptomyces hiroshimensis]|uniref:Lipoprotein n=1 Tax=Streptomyces hiroshimensis TaxID=66424 RepID=A0ABQ2YA86_9ACTN|nr:hypothetical protein [Streptomyces hiroshimensis]GGX77145.1 hypothetical protein GCM10010324_23290 [Streptomyces hiroshimensis]